MAKRLALLGSILFAAAMLRGEERRSLDLVWLDPHGLFPDVERVRSEAESVFRDLGVAVRWEVGSDPRPSAWGAWGERRIHVVLMPSEPAGWGIPANAMGVVLLPNRSPQDTVYLFFRPILRGIGLGGREGTMLKPRERRDASRAIARILIHEVIHAIAPRLSHAEEGVMHDSLLPGVLSRRDLEIDDRTREALLRALE